MEGVLSVLVSKRGWSTDDSDNGGGSASTSSVQELSLQRRGLESLLMPGSGAPVLVEFGFTNLVVLDLARNAISCLKGLEHLSLLETLVLYMNKVADGREILRLENNRNLKNLDCRLNMVSKATWFRYFVLQNLPKLEKLDEQSILAYERRKANEVPAISYSDLNYRDDDSDSSSDEGVVSHSDRGVVEQDVLADQDLDSEILADKADTAAHLALESPIDGVALANELNKVYQSTIADEEEEEEEDEEEDHETTDDEASDEENSSLDQSLLRVLKYVREQMDAPPITKSDWQGKIEGLNTALVKVVNCRKQEKKQQNSALAHTDSLRLQVERLKKMVGERENELSAAQRKLDDLANGRKDAEQAPSNDMSCKSEPQARLSASENDNVYTKVPAMLLEAHNALIASNRTLLQELEDLKARYRADEQQWTQNFNQLRKLHSDYEE